MCAQVVKPTRQAANVCTLDGIYIAFYRDQIIAKTCPLKCRQYSFKYKIDSSLQSYKYFGNYKLNAFNYS